MTEDEFVALVGETILHVTPSTNLPGINQAGLLSAQRLFKLGGIDPKTVVPRLEPLSFETEIGKVRVNHQRPLLAGKVRAHDFLDGYDLVGWAEQLDRRVFFWPSKNLRGDFSKSIDDAAQLIFDARTFYRKLRDVAYLSPINSGNATRRPAKRGDWLYASLKEAAGTFKFKRRERGLVGQADRVQEISVNYEVNTTMMNEMRIA